MSEYLFSWNNNYREIKMEVTEIKRVTAYLLSQERVDSVALVKGRGREFKSENMQK